MSNETMAAQAQLNNTNSTTVSNETITVLEAPEILPVQMNDTEMDFADQAIIEPEKE